MSESTPVQVLIVGAGPTGLALACHLLRLGVRVRIIDLKPGPSTTSKALGLQYRISEVLACMGIVDRFVARGRSPMGINVHANGRKLVHLKFLVSEHVSGRDAFAPRAIILPQSETEALLGEEVAARGGRVEWNTEFLDFTQDDSGVVTRVRSADGREEVVRSDWLVSCEGAHSLVRKQAGISFTGKTYPLAYFMADVELDWALEPNAVQVWMHPDGSFAAMPLPRPGTWRLLVEVTREPNQLQGEITLEVIRALMARRLGDRVTKITNPTWISEFRIHCRMVDRYREGRVFLAGDAAHIHSPTGGQGIVTGIQDATNLAWKLARVLRGAPEELLDTYEQERLPKAREVLRETDRSTTLLAAPTLLTRLIRDYLILPIARMDWVQKKMFGRMAQLHVHYRDSSLSSHQDTFSWLSRTRLRAGDRAPDVAFRKADSGEQTTLFELLQPMRPVALIGSESLSADPYRLTRLIATLARFDINAYLLASPEEQPAPTNPRCLIDVHGDFRKMYGMTGQFLCLIRPDDHIGLFQRPINEPALDDYLAHLGAPEVLAEVRRTPKPVHIRPSVAAVS
jgi:2-polyprenyl-6-methoxyphenol hydroxylase-like FAD-dependent oxidoreductase